MTVSNIIDNNININNSSTHKYFNFRSVGNLLHRFSSRAVGSSFVEYSFPFLSKIALLKTKDTNQNIPETYLLFSVLSIYNCS